MKILLFGSSGQLGQEFMNIEGLNVCGITHEDLEIRNNDQRAEMIRHMRPDVVINCTAYHKVDECENNPWMAHTVNTLVPGSLAVECHAIQAKLVHISTDYVFGGDTKRRELYTEMALVAPINVYGLTKAMGEKLIDAAIPNHLIIRTSALFGATTSRKGWTFPEMVLERAKAGDEMDIVKDQITVPTYTKDLAAKIMELINADKTGLYHCVSEGINRIASVSWCEFALTTLEFANVRGVVNPIETIRTREEQAWRPHYSVLTTIKLTNEGLGTMRSWKEALKVYLREKGY